MGAASAPRSHREGVLWHDLALGPTLSHWESQSTTTEPFVCLGFARYESHEGERPMAWGNLCGGWSGRSRRRGCQAVAWHSGGVGGLRGHAGAASVLL